MTAIDKFTTFLWIVGLILCIFSLWAGIGLIFTFFYLIFMGLYHFGIKTYQSKDWDSFGVLLFTLGCILALIFIF